jgi:hypothetical protein
MDSSDLFEISNPDPKYVVSSISQSEQLLAAIEDPGDLLILRNALPIRLLKRRVSLMVATINFTSLSNHQPM